MGDFQKLKVWQRAKELAVFVYQTTGGGLFEKNYGLRDHMRKTVISISSNIAEGDELGTNRQSVRHFRIAKGSTAELLSQAIIAHEIGYLTQSQFDHIKEECQAISSMLTRLIRVRAKD
ncbi:MAG: four helix bundle protein [Deltaproteobacteria bacterium]|nr:four helix bundle protein [Deltaproteobacteria bacterium]